MPPAARGSPRPPPPWRGRRSRRCPASPRSCAPRPSALSRSLRQPRALRADVDDAGKRQHHRRLVQHHLRRRPSASRRPAAADLGDARRAGGSRRSSARRAPGVSGAASRSRIGVVTAGGTFISVRTERTSEISRTTQSSSSRAAAASGTGDRFRPRCADQAAFRLAVAEAVPQFLGDERHRRVQQPQDRAQHMLRRARTSSSPPRPDRSAPAWRIRRTSRRTCPR